MSTETPLVSFVVVNYKMVDALRHLLRGIEAARPNFSYEFFLVDNDSRDSVAELVSASFPWVKLDRKSVV